MSYSVEDAMFDWHAMEEEWQRALQEAIEEIPRERLKRFFLDHPDVISRPIALYNEARRLCDGGFHAAGLVFAAASFEASLRDLILRPLLIGLANSEKGGELLSELLFDVAIGRLTSSDKPHALLQTLIQELTEQDLNKYKLRSSSRDIWTDWNWLRRVRNDVLHRQALPETVSQLDSERSVAIAGEMIRDLFGQVLSTMDLLMQDGLIFEAS